MCLDLRCLYKSLMFASLLLAYSSNAAAEFGFSPYVTAGFGLSRLAPDPGDSGLEVTESASTGYSAMLGLDISDRFSLEGGLNVLGTATLDSATSAEQEISYSALSVGAVLHLLGDSRDIAEREGLWMYARLGASQLDNESDLDLQKSDDIAIWGGLGVEWAFSSMFGIRGELATFDGDAQALTTSLVFRPFNRGRSSRTKIVAPTPSEAPAAPAAPAAPERLPIPENDSSSLADLPAANGVGGCESPAANEPVGPDGCARLSGVRSGIQFVPGTNQLTGGGRSAVASLAAVMQSAPSMRIQIRSHAVSPNGAEASQALSRQRAVEVAKALVASGVTVDRIDARAFGSNEPTVQIGSARGQVVPDRIVFVVQ